MLPLQEDSVTPKLEEIQSLATPRGTVDGPRRRLHEATHEEQVSVVVAYDLPPPSHASNHHEISGAGDTVMGAPTMSPSPKKQPPLAPAKRPAPAAKILFLDGLRGLAALLVVLQHSGYMLDILVGCTAVDVFFVLSSFLLTMLFERKARKLMQQRAGPRSWAVALVDYFVKRLLRVYPLFFVISCVLWTLPDDKKTQYFYISEPPFELARVLTFEFPYRYHVFWTLPVEIGYYFVIPVFVVVFLLLRKYWWIPMLPMIVYIIHQTCYVYRSHHQGLAPHFSTFLAGSCAAFIFARAQQALQEHQKEIEPHREWIIRGVRLIELVALAVLFSSCSNGMFFTWLDVPPIHLEGSFFFVSVPISAMIVAEMLFPWVMSEVLEWSVLRFLGKISFSLYMVHSFVIYSDFIQRQTYYDGVVARLGLSCMLSSLSYHLVEVPCQKVAVRISKAVNRLDPLAVPPAAPTIGSEASAGCCSWFSTTGSKSSKYKSVDADAA